MLEITDEGVVGSCREGEREAPEVPLEDNDGEGHHNNPEHGEGRLSSGKTRVQEGDARDHEKDETGGEDDEGLVAGLVPLVEVLGSWRRIVLVLDCDDDEYSRCRRRKNILESPPSSSLVPLKAVGGPGIT